MKNRLNLFGVALVIATIIPGVALPVKAEDTNEVQQAPKAEKKIFLFNGGGPVEFILAMDKHFRTRLGQILSIPSSLARAEVPRMRIATDNPEDALKVYNHLQDPMLGQWKYDGPSREPSVLALVPDKEVALSRAAATGAKVKALGLAGVPKNQWKDLEKDVDVARDVAKRMTDQLGGERCEGGIYIQPDSKILIVSGSEGFIEMVESVVAAHRSNAQVESKTIDATK
jgi:hypothetical protein